MQEKIFDVLFDQQDVTWKDMIFNAVKSEQMDPWDIDISALARRFLDMVHQFKEMDFSISGKVILAAAILLRIKSNKLLTDDLGELDRLIAMGEQSDDDFYEGLDEDYAEKGRIITDEEKFKLIPRTPQPRKRKVSVYDLVEALNQALEVRKRRVKRHMDIEAIEVHIPTKKYDISELIGNIYQEIIGYLWDKKQNTVSFSQLVNSDDRDAKIFTFIPLLHLTNQHKVGIDQKYHLADIDVFFPEGKVFTPEQIQVEIDEAKDAYKAEDEEDPIDLFKDNTEKTKKKSKKGKKSKK
ncbi:segregation/condensation protein A [Candidatus Woesearchaeota archaeon]|jgi:segregation and condensation protein A|nr:segregation/condensation protein A [Candidatus Woesearchaeota archaeon]MBT5272665.1 segregation/condensation protein A [Candidatus Woesearchaeota archaeon]MBT6337217.1 segregation/condensation protein A [Candidatus Woesearchaeota archaeon]MBT7928145.1 segregation/condensation protein A [Candidatus Woesearchaeota archaeon]